MTQKIRVLVNGAKGKMGSEAVRAVGGAEDMEIVAQTDMGDDLAATIKSSNADVVVDLTAPSCAYANANAIIESGAGGVIGTTGFTTENIQDLTRKCGGRTPAVLIAPNFSIGAVLMMHCSQIIGRYMPDVEIIELHHPAKLDAPSGTAVKTAQLIAESRGKGNVPRGTSEPAARGERFSDIPIHSVRLPGLLAHQAVIFGGEGQTLTLRHDSLNRGCFMPGVLLGIREVVKRSGLIYGLDNLLFSNPE
ncbi:MAG: 4-hydroxy-tetrahydrodipicolinate reductase [Candidatus Omnitrophica bacterium]|nr:4-hydroxy-tetrahydrodipicolinate reductase [Candidatus Omnitrophota bacterium]